MLAFLTAVAARVFFGVGGALDIGAASALPALLDVQLFALTLLLIWLRDVPLGASPAKWLLCLTVIGRDGRRLGPGRRLLRALVGIVPLALVRPDVERRVFGWRVVSYSPSRTGLVSRTALTAGAAVFSVTWAFETVRPSIGRGAARDLAEVLLDDPLLPRTLGEPLHYEIGSVTRRARQPGASHRASFRLRILGPNARQDMVVHARKVDGAWTLEELTEIEVTVAEADTPHVARR